MARTSAVSKIRSSPPASTRTRADEACRSTPSMRWPLVSSTTTAAADAAGASRTRTRSAPMTALRSGRGTARNTLVANIRGRPRVPSGASPGQGNGAAGSVQGDRAGVRLDRVRGAGYVRRAGGPGEGAAMESGLGGSGAARYDALMDVVRHRTTNRAFAPCQVPRIHFEMILEAARHAPSGANAQPWHYVIVTDPAVKQAIGQCFVDEQQHRAKLRMGFPTPNYNGVKTAPGLIVVVADFRFIKAFPVLNDGSELDRLYKAERRADPPPVRGRLDHVGPPRRRGPRLRRVVDHRHWTGGHPAADQATPRRARRARRHRRDVLRAAAQAVLQAVEEAARPDRELGALRTRQLHDRGGDRGVGQEHSAQGHVPGRVEDRLKGGATGPVRRSRRSFAPAPLGSRRHTARRAWDRRSACRCCPDSSARGAPRKP